MKHSRSSLFLMELIIAILFFSLAGAVCIRLFAKSHLLSIQTVNENHAVIQAQNLAEIFLASDGDPVQLETVLKEIPTEDPEDTFRFYFDENWKKSDNASACYTAELKTFPEENGLIKADIRVYCDGSYETPLYSLSIVHHAAVRRGNLEK